MDIHKPKPWHSLREFLKEYVIIVVGVLTALGAEAGVEWLHWHHRAEAAREALAADFQRVLFWTDERIAETPCMARRLDELTDIVDRASRDRHLPPLGIIRRINRRPWDLRTWDSLVSSQTLAHLPRKEMLGYSSIALYLSSLQPIREQETQNWAILNSLSGPARPFSEAEEAHIRSVLSVATADAANMGTFMREIRSDIVALGELTPTQVSDAAKAGAANAARQDICQPIGQVPTRAGGLLPRLEAYDPNDADPVPSLTARYGPRAGWKP